MGLIMIVGIILIAISAVVNLIEIRKFIKALQLLNHCTVTIKDKIAYPIRLIKLTVLLSPVVLDLIIIGAGTGVGLGKGPTGFVLGLAASCFITLGIKIMFFLFKPKTEGKDFNTEYSKLKTSW
jgi:hypothetical protein